MRPRSSGGGGEVEEPTRRQEWYGAAREIGIKGLWFPGLVFAGHVVAARVFLAYESVPLLDIPVHLLGGAAIAFLFVRGIAILARRRLIEAPDRVVKTALLFGLICAAALFWEFAEYVSDHTIGTQAQLGLEDTLFDMLLGVIGGLTFVFLRGG